MNRLHWLPPSSQLDFFSTLWRTDFFRYQAVHDPWLSGLLKRVAKRPHAVAQQSSELERLHFSTFWNVWIFHEHDNPYIFDLGVLHELLHTFLFQSKRVWSTTSELWNLDALSQMEREVSLRTEVCVYRKWPDLRAFTFSMPIWADAVQSHSWPDIKFRRKALMDAGCMGDTFANPEEQRIAKYAKMNQRWNAAWSEHGPRIEQAWQASYLQPERTPSFFEPLFEIDAVDGIPFFALAKRFGSTPTMNTAASRPPLTQVSS
jgi:hypothetical protein